MPLLSAYRGVRMTNETCFIPPSRITPGKLHNYTKNELIDLSISLKIKNRELKIKIRKMNDGLIQLQRNIQKVKEGFQKYTKM